MIERKAADRMMPGGVGTRRVVLSKLFPMHGLNARELDLASVGILQVANQLTATRVNTSSKGRRVWDCV